MNWRTIKTVRYNYLLNKSLLSKYTSYIIIDFRGILNLVKDPDAQKDWRQEEKGMTEDEVVGWHHWLNRHEFEQALEDGEGQGSLVCCSSWDHKELDMTELMNNNNKLPRQPNGRDGIWAQVYSALKVTLFSTTIWQEISWRSYISKGP